MADERWNRFNKPEWYGRDYFVTPKGMKYRDGSGQTHGWSYDNPSGEMEVADLVTRAWKKMFKPKNMLDVGTGRGTVVAYARKNRIEAYGFDFSDWALTEGLYRGCNPEWLKIHDATKPWPYGDESFDLVTALDFCTPSGTRVVTREGLRPIEEITIGTEVLTHKGRNRRVIKTFKRSYTGQLVRIKVRFFKEATFTPEHPILVFRKGEIEWIQASQLRKGSQIAYPIDNNVEDVDVLRISDFVENPLQYKVYQEAMSMLKKGLTRKRVSETLSVPLGTLDHWKYEKRYPRNCYIKEDGYLFYPHKPHNKIKDVFPINGDFMRFLGYFLADGCVQGNYTNFYFADSEKENLNDLEEVVSRLWGINHVSEVPRKGRIQISVGSKLLAEFLNAIFEKVYSYTKKIPRFVMLLPIKKQRNLIKAMWRGDGSIGGKGFQYSTTSESLAHQIKMLLLRQGIIPAVGRYENSSGFEGYPSDKKIYQLHIAGVWLEKASEILGIKHPYIEKRRITRRHAGISKGYAILPVNSVEQEPFNGCVYNLEVEEDNSYTTTSICAHNCEHIYLEDLPFVESELRRVSRRWCFLEIAIAGTGGLQGEEPEGYILHKGEPVPLELEANAVAGHVSVRPKKWWVKRFEEKGFVERRDMLHEFSKLVYPPMIKNWWLNAILILEKGI